MGSKQTPTDSKRDFAIEKLVVKLSVIQIILFEAHECQPLGFQGGGNFFSRSMVNENDEKTWEFPQSSLIDWSLWVEMILDATIIVWYWSKLKFCTKKLLLSLLALF